MHLFPLIEPSFIASLSSLFAVLFKRRHFFHVRTRLVEHEVNSLYTVHLVLSAIFSFWFFFLNFFEEAAHLENSEVQTMPEKHFLKTAVLSTTDCRSFIEEKNILRTKFLISLILSPLNGILSQALFSLFWQPLHSTFQLSIVFDKMDARNRRKQSPDKTQKNVHRQEAAVC